MYLGEIFVYLGEVFVHSCEERTTTRAKSGLEPGTRSSVKSMGRKKKQHKIIN